MESLEDVDLTRSLNQRGSARFVQLVEEDFAGLILAAQASKSSGSTDNASEEDPSSKLCRLSFPPLKPRYSTLLQISAARFGLKASLHGWGDERKILVDATPASSLPLVECADFFPGCSSANRLAERAVPLPTRQNYPKVIPRLDEDTGSATREESTAVRGGMQGWGDDESDDDWIVKRRKASVASGKVSKGRGFQKNGGEVAASCETGPPEYQMRNDYSKYTIDPEENWSPHKKPWVELASSWEFSGAWSFDPDDQERFEGTRDLVDAESRGVAVWRVEHGRGGNFTVAIISGNPGHARQWLGGHKGRGDEPFILEFQLHAERNEWEFRFGRASSPREWRKLPWSSEHRSSFWLATIPGDDGKQQILAGLDEFPERRFFVAKVRMRPSAIGFGPPMGASVPGGTPFYVRDIAIFGRGSLRSPPFAQRDHFVELPSMRCEDVRKALERLDYGEKTRCALELPDVGSGTGTLLVCDAAETAAQVAELFSGTAVKSLQWTWPPASQSSSLEATREHAENIRQNWAKLRKDTILELAIFEEHVHRQTRHLENVRIARDSATRAILGNLRGAAPLPKPPEVVG